MVVPTAGAGITPVFTGAAPRDNKSFVGTELMAQISWRFAPGLAWDNQFGYMFMGPALDGVTDPTHRCAQYQRPVDDHLSHPLHVLARESAVPSGPGGNPRARCFFTVSCRHPTGDV